MKTPPVLRPGLLFVMFALATFLVFSCSGDKGTSTSDDDGFSRTTAEGLLEAYASYYTEKDLDGCSDCLCEDFVFVFTDDVADSLDLPPEEPWWGKADDLASTGSMFADPQVVDIDFSYGYVVEWTPGEKVMDDTTHDGLWCRIEPSISVVLDTDGGESLRLWVNNSYLDITVVPDQDVEGCWCVLMMQEIAIPPGPREAAVRAGTKPTKWGWIKSMWAD